MSAVLLLCITVFNCVIMLPMYLTGDPIPTDDWRLTDLSSMNAATILNITANEGKMITAFVCAILVVPSFAFFMIYKFR